MMYREFTVTECVRCPDLVLTGVVAGLTFRLDRRTIPPAHAAVVKHYGFPVLVIDRRLSGLHADFWEPEHDLTKPGRHLAIPHHCGSDHSTPREQS
ncbi:hypothetical protein OG992_18770 [Micromonospora sp. NBC_00362]|uniref:hypothetical protein n=1 Tax=Micromonospora sp. NBC_00362 TaxID=2975975 RepID=UPI0022505111|nr:hypothetical protein [Micromonospora sp. NBC_00362]MCX5119233.1 hypothetical protein [Micromonospora sp. NBC_00362]